MRLESTSFVLKANRLGLFAATGTVRLSHGGADETRLLPRQLSHRPDATLPKEARL